MSKLRVNHYPPSLIEMTRLSIKLNGYALIEETKNKSKIKITSNNKSKCHIIFDYEISDLDIDIIADIKRNFLKEWKEINSLEKFLYDMV